MTDPLTPPARRWLLGVVVAGLLGRVALLVFPSYRFDREVFTGWGQALRSAPWSEFYVGTSADHLPGDLVLHGLLAHVADPYDAAGYGLALRLVPLLVDVLVVVLLWRGLGQRFGEVSGASAAAGYALSAGLAMAGTGWGQWDVVSFGLLLAGSVVALRWSSGGWVLAAPLMTWAVLTKPQLALPAAMVMAASPLAALIGRQSLRRWAEEWGLRLTAALSLSIVLAIALVTPFGLSLFGDGPASVRGRMLAALERWPARTMEATNVWMLTQPDPWMHPDSVRVLGLTYQVWGYLLLWSVLAMVVAGWWLRRSNDHAPMAVWAATAVAFASYALTTRAHDRYVFPAAALVWVLVAVSGGKLRVGALAVWVNVLAAAQVGICWYKDSHGGDAVPFVVWQVVSLLVVLTLPVLLSWPAWAGARVGRHRPE